MGSSAPAGDVLHHLSTSLCVEAAHFSVHSSVHLCVYRLFIQYLLIDEQRCSYQFIRLLWKCPVWLGPSCPPGVLPPPWGHQGVMGVDTFIVRGAGPTQTQPTWRDQRANAEQTAGVGGLLSRCRPPAFALHTTLASPGQAPSRRGHEGGFLPVSVVSFLGPALSWAHMRATDPSQQYEPT